MSRKISERVENALDRMETKVDTRRMDHTVSVRINSVLADLELLISVTPTGEKRNALTEANIHAMQLRDAFAKARGTNNA